ncbi:diguanylate cyclase [Sporomusa malonica]|uniref:Diguanylate cyclase (GGDEF) domain-containing protein n=1 Tax=Sporomusa malonica TaxID=112901 RepID=A0A1W2EDZ7_9FIRM|nr:diguanylate cyclase [Sporomusa malonica]SMD07622.1 diguanylate cyclase (GGDEF) domain-containing protein [Sporomusa malonica]
MRNIPASSLAMDVLLKMAIGATLVVLLVTSLGYWYVYGKAEQEAIDNLKKFVINRTQHEAIMFKLAEDNLHVFKNKYLTSYQVAHEFSDEDFDALFFRDAKGATRMKREYYDGTLTPTGLYSSGMSGFIGNNVKVLNADLKRRLILGYHLIAEMGPGCKTRFANFFLHATYPENAIIIYYPESPWGLNARADLIMTDGAVVKATLQQYNPKRRAVWTGLYYDLTANQWAITYELPVDYEGRHLITPSHDIQLNDLIDRMISEHLEGSYNFIVSADGNLVAHPQKLDEIKQQMGVLSLEKLGDPTLSSMYEQIKKSGEVVTDDVKIIDDHVNGTYLAVARMAGPEWLYVTVYPKNLISNEAHSTAKIIIVIGMTFFFFMMLIVLYVIRKNVAIPVQLLKIAAEKISEGDYGVVIDGKLKLPDSAPNEISLLVKAFRHMAIQIRDANKILEDKIEERTQALEAVNEKLTALSFLDGLTGIYNRRAFDQTFHVKFEEAREGRDNFALMICDIDFFKLYNDQYGHETGDQALKETADTLVRNSGTLGHVYRYGGEEFAIIMENDLLSSYEERALNLLKAVEKLNREHRMSPYGVLTVSAGLAVYNEAFQDIKDMFITADQNLYTSKKAGRNQLTL